MRRLIGSAAAVALLAGFGPAQAATFKCQGADGKVVFSDQRCPPTDEERLRELEAALKAPGTADMKASIQKQIDTIKQRSRDAAAKKAEEKGARK